jgi:elongation factor Ts
VSEKIDAKLVKELREKSGAPMGDCLKALQETKGNIEDAFVVLRKRGMASAQKKAARTTNEARWAPTFTPAARSACCWS